jgi:hypothetical protein
MLSFRSNNIERGAAMVEFAMVAGVVAFTIAVPLLLTLLPRYRAALDDGSVRMATQAIRPIDFPFAEIGPDGELRQLANCEDTDPLTAVENTLEGISETDGFCALLVGDEHIAGRSAGCDASVNYNSLSQEIRDSHESMSAAGRS